MLDLFDEFVTLVNALDEAHNRVTIEWEHGTVSVVSREGLITLKKLRGSGQDQDDIKHLLEDDR